MKFKKSHVCKELRMALGTYNSNNRYCFAMSVRNPLVSYMEYYDISDEQYHSFAKSCVNVVDFRNACARRENDDLLIEKPGRLRGSADEISINDVKCSWQEFR
jgi:hypothetical protein